jgi:hypothetical protein
MTHVVVQLARHAVSAAGSQRHAAFTKAKDFGVTLTPMHPQSSDPALSCWFQAEVEHGQADAVAESLRGVPDVTAAYVKPRPARPGSL